MRGWLPGGKSMTANRVPFAAGAVPMMRAPKSSICSPTAMSVGVRSVDQISVETAGARILGIGGRALHEHLGDVVGVVAGHETANGRILFGHDGYASLQRGFPNLQSSFAPTALTNAPQCAKSSWMSLENCAGVRSTRSKLFTRKNSRDCGNSKTLAT